MIVKFFVYRKDSGEIIYMIPNIPDNTDYTISRGDIWYEGKKVLGGINWDVVDYEVIDPSVELEGEPGMYIYNPTTGEISSNPNWSPSDE